MNKYRHQVKSKAIYQPVIGEMEPERKNGVLTPAQQKLDIQIITKLFWCMGGNQGKEEVNELFQELRP